MLYRYATPLVTPSPKLSYSFIKISFPQSYEYQIEEKLKVFAEIKVTVTLSIEVNAKLVVKIEAVFAKVGIF